jgi:hypothetical protein
MDPVSLTLGALPIATQLLRSCLTGYQIIADIFTAGEDSQIALCQLQIEETRLRLWAQDAGIDAGAEEEQDELDRRLEKRGIRNVVLLILAHMAGIFVNTKQLRSRYGILRRQVSSEQLSSGPSVPELPHTAADAAANLRKDKGALGDQEKAIRRYVDQTQSSLSFLRKARFVLNDKRKFAGFVEQLRYFNDALNSLVSRSSSQHVALDLALLAKIVSGTAVDAELETIKAASEKSYQPLSTSATLKRLRLSIQNSKGQINGFPTNAYTYLSNSEIRKKWALLQLENHNAHRSLGSYGKPGDEQPVIIEWKHFDRSLPRDDTVDRIQDIARYLHATSSCRSPDLPVLECIGYVEDFEQPRCCFLYLLPRTFTSPINESPSPKVTIRTLADLIPAQFSRKAVPPLEHRYRLAQTLAIALFRLHLTGWLHKGIRSSNIVFLDSQDEQNKADVLLSPWLLGFDYSRPDRVTAISDRAPTEMTSSEWDLYVHPDYMTARHEAQSSSNDDGRYKRTYDIYSLGLVLFEIALWEPLSTFRRKKHTAVEFKAAVLKIAEDEVGGAMGGKYRDVVVSCINGTAVAENKEEGLDVYLKVVVNKLLTTAW